MTSDCHGVLAALLAFGALSLPFDGNATPRVLFTIDVESMDTLTLPQQVDAVCKDGSGCGLMEIARMLKERGWAGTFFLNVYEYRKWGETAMRDIAVKLQTGDQDVALHTHPQWAYDPLRNGMHQYSLDEQTAIIRDGVDLLAAWTGRPVVAHRAGDYAADERTLEALERNGLRLDSSLFWGHASCRLTGLGLPRNLPAFRGRLVEIPVTVYQREERARGFGDILTAATSIRKIDVDWFLDEDEARAAVDAVVEADLPFLVVFLHSFSFLAGHGDGGAPVEDRHARDIFRAILKRVAERHLVVATMRELAESKAAAPTSQNEDVLPRVTVRVGLHRYLWHRLKAVGVGRWGEGAVVVLIVVAGGVVLIAVSRRRLGGRSATRSGVSSR